MTVDQLYYIVASANFASLIIDKAEVLKLLNKFAAKETSPSGLSAVLATAALVKGATDTELEAFSPLVKKIAEQADEADGIILFVYLSLNNLINFLCLVRKRSLYYCICH